jgi:hypothetical protein
MPMIIRGIDVETLFPPGETPSLKMQDMAVRQQLIVRQPSKEEYTSA